MNNIEGQKTRAFGSQTRETVRMETKQQSPRKGTVKERQEKKADTMV
jgi:hypothetical protein